MIEISHPRSSAGLVGAETAEVDFLAALARGRLHHAWLLVGPPGVGKATFAYRAARRLLGARPDPAFGALGASPDDPTFRQVAGRAHPDFVALEIDESEGRARKSISVEDARSLPEFFSKSPGRAAWRVAVIDTADDLSASAANAVLKTLEEPPVRGVLLLVSHRPGALLPTLRSRCRRLVFAPPPAQLASAWLEQTAELSPEAGGLYLRMARGAPGRALRLAAADALDLDRSARALIEALPRIDPAAAQAVADGFRGTQGAARFALVMDRLAAALKDRIGVLADAGAERLDRWAEAWSLVSDLPGEVDGLNLDRADAFFTALERLGALR
jgi:DNA polymerase-3 subunit delta'